MEEMEDMYDEMDHDLKGIFLPSASAPFFLPHTLSGTDPTVLFFFWTPVPARTSRLKPAWGSGTGGEKAGAGLGVRVLGSIFRV